MESASSSDSIVSISSLGSREKEDQNVFEELNVEVEESNVHVPGNETDNVLGDTELLTASTLAEVDNNLNKSDSEESTSSSSLSFLASLLDSDSEVASSPLSHSDSNVASSSSSLSDSDSDSGSCSIVPSDYYHYGGDSWPESIETFINQLNDFDYLSDHHSEENFDNDDGSEAECEKDKAVPETQRLLAYFVVPILISQLFMLIAFSNIGTGRIDARSSVIPVTVHHHHYYHIDHVHQHKKYCRFYFFESGEKGGQNNQSKFKGFLYILFNPLDAFLSSKYFLWIRVEFKKHASIPDGFLCKIGKLTGYVRKEIESEIGNALRIRDNWNRAVYKQIYKLAESPQYQRVVKWIGTIKDRLFS